MNYFASWGFLRVRDAVRRGNKISELGLFSVMEHDMGELFCCLDVTTRYEYVFIHTWLCKNFSNFCWSFVLITTGIYKVLELDK